MNDTQPPTVDEPVTMKVLPDVDSPLKSQLPVLMKPTAATKIRELEKHSDELEKLHVDDPDRILKLAGRMDLLPSSVLAGFLGGAVGSTAGIILGGFTIAAIAMPAVAITGPLGMAAGVAAAILMWRGPRTWYIERETARITKVLDEIDLRINKALQQFKQLPKDAPDYIREQHWKQYSQLLRKRADIEERFAFLLTPNSPD